MSSEYTQVFGFMSHLFTLNISPTWFTTRDNPENLMYFDRVEIVRPILQYFTVKNGLFLKNSEGA